MEEVCCGKTMTLTPAGWGVGHKRTAEHMNAHKHKPASPICSGTDERGINTRQVFGVFFAFVVQINGESDNLQADIWACLVCSLRPLTADFKRSTLFTPLCEYECVYLFNCPLPSFLHVISLFLKLPSILSNCTNKRTHPYRERCAVALIS